MPVITFKVSPEEARQLRAKARAERAPSLSEFLRRSVLAGEPAAARISRRRHPVSGLPYNAAPGRRVSVEEIRAALADFP